MRVVVDANILIAALFGSRARQLILTSQNHLFFGPETIIREVEKLRKELAIARNSTEEEIREAFDALLVFIDIVSYEKYASYYIIAYEALKERDTTDVPYLACALAVHADFIWTEDNDFSFQNLVQTKTTTEFLASQK